MIPILISVVIAQAPVQTLGPLDDFFGTNLRNLLGHQNYRQQYDWHCPAGNSAFTNSMIPSAIKGEATEWLRRVLKQEFIPAGMSGRWLGARTPKMDYLYDRFRNLGIAFMLTEDSHSMVIAIRDGDTAEATNLEPLTEFARTKARAYLNFPEAETEAVGAELRWLPKTDPGKAARGEVGTLIGQPRNELSTWFHVVYVYTDGQTVVFDVMKVLPGSISTGGQAADPFYVYKPRFGPHP